MIFQKFLKKSERGQAIILIAFAIIGLIGMVGLMTDGGILLIEYARLKRGIDAASVSAALQFRKGYVVNDLRTSAEEFLRFNQADVYNVLVETCVTNPGDTTLCTVPLRKLVRITASSHVEFGFMRVLGIRSTDITAASVGEAASIDLVLVMDTSISMAYETSGDPNQLDTGDDPTACNTNSNCQPLESIKSVALDFIDTMFFPYDRVAIVTMTGQNGLTGTSSDYLRNPVTVLALEDDDAVVRSAIQNIKVFQPRNCPTAFGPCLNYGQVAADEPSPAVGAPFQGQECTIYRWGPDLRRGYIDINNPGSGTGDENYDPSSCTSSNVGGALLLAGTEFAREPIREDSFWVVIALVGGPANATDAASGYPYGYCPTNTHNSPTNPFCRDALSSTRHTSGVNYDADDYARDMADFLASPEDGQGVTVFTIGLGNLVRNAAKGDADSGEQLLTYIAEQAGDSATATANHGEYFFSPDASGLAAIFQRIADNIFTRISQ